MRFTKKAVCLILVLIIFSVLSGCWDQKEITELAIVTGIGFDKGSEADKTDYIFQIGKPAERGSQQGSKTSSDEKAFFVVDDEFKSLAEALNEMNKETSRGLFLHHNSSLILGRQFAETGGLEKQIDALLRTRDSRLETLMVVSDSTAKDLLTGEFSLDKISGNGIARMIYDIDNNTETYTVSLFLYAKKFLEKTTAPVMPVIKTEKVNDIDKYSIIGLGVFKDHKMIGQMDVSLTRGYSWALGQYKQVYMTAESEAGTANVFIQGVEQKLSSEIKPDGTPLLKISTSFVFSPSDIQGYDGLDLQQMKDTLERSVDKTVEDSIRATFNYSKSINADLFGLGASLYTRKPKEWKPYENRWEQVYPTAELEIKVEGKFRESGKITRSLRMKEK
jgi:germination protein, Ger(x)C family